MGLDLASHRNLLPSSLDADPWLLRASIQGHSTKPVERFDLATSNLGSVGWSDASLNNAAGLTGHVVQLVLDAMRGTR